VIDGSVAIAREEDFIDRGHVEFLTMRG
jgi:hypothetical protein